MNHEQLVYSLPYLDSANVSLASSSETSFYCSKAYYFQDNGQNYRLSSNYTLDRISYLCQTGLTFKLVMLYITLILGVPGNALAIITMATMPKSTGTFYILVLAITDLFAIAIRATERFLSHYEIWFPPEACKFCQGISQLSVIYANWILVLICIERFVTVRFPLQKRFYFTMKTAKISILALFLVLVPVAVVDILAITSMQGKCTTSPDYSVFYTTVWIHVLSALYSFAPAGLILLFVVLVASALKMHRRERKTILGDPQENSSNGNPIMRRKRLEMQKAERLMTTMMFFTFIIFLVITIPTCIAIIIKIEMDKWETTPVLIAESQLLLIITSSLNLLNHAVNFYVYFLSARKFRSRLFILLKKFSPSCFYSQDIVDESRETEIQELT